MSGLFAGPGMGGWRDSGLVIAAETAWDVTRTAPFYVFSGLSALLLLGTGAGMPVVLVAWLGVSWWLARQTDDRWGRVLRHPWELGGWLAVPIGLAVAVGLGMTNLALALLLIGTMSAARWVTPRRIERTEQTVPITYAETADREEWDAWTLDWVWRRWPEIAQDAGLSYKRNIEQKMSRSAAELWVTDPLYRQEAKIRELTEGRSPTFEWVPPTLMAIHVTRLGPILRVRPWGGQEPADYARAAARIATSYELRGATVAVTEPGLIDLQLLGSDPLSAHGEPVDVTAFATPVAVTDPWHVGEDEAGEPVLIDLAAGAHLLVAGATRSGKSVGTYGLITHVLRMGSAARLLVADPNDTTLAPFEEKLAWSTSSVDPEPVTEMLQWVRREMDRRKPILRSMRQDKVEPWQFSADLPLIVVVIDEAANYLRHSAGKPMKEELLAVVSQGAKYGIRLVLITQRPDSTILDTSTRAQLSARLCFRVEDRQTASMVFPDLEDPDTLLTMPPGVGYVREVGGQARRFRGLYLADHWGAADMIPAPQPRIDVTADGLAAPAQARSATAPTPESSSPGPEATLPEPLTVADLHEAGEVGARTANRLGAYTLVELTRWTRAELLDLPGIGVGSVTELEAALHARGMALRPDDEDAA